MPIDPMMGFHTPTTAAPSFWDRVQSGLFGPGQSYGGLLSAEDQAAARRQAMLAMGTQMMQAGGYSQTPVSFGQALGSGIQAGQQGQKSSMDDALQAMLIKTKLHTKPQRKPVAVLGPDGKTPIYVGEEDAIGRTPIPSRENQVPSSVTEWQMYNAMSPAEKAQYLEMKRAQQFRLDSVNGVPTAVTTSAGAAPGAPQVNATPLTNFDAQANANAEAERRKSEAGALGTGQGNIAAGIQTKGANADLVTSLVEEAKPLIPQATGSTAGAGLDAVAGFVGHANTGAKAIARLKVIQAGLMMNMPRMEGPQSDRDVQNYKDAAGQIADPSVPNELKLDALDTIQSIQQRYADRAAGAGAPSAVGVPTPGKSQTQKTVGGKKYVQVNGKWYEDDGT